MAVSGQKTVTAAGTAVQLGTVLVNGPLLVKALVGNAGDVYLGNDGAGDVTLSNGLELSPGDVVVFEFVGTLGALYLDAANNGDGVAWLLLSV